MNQTPLSIVLIDDNPNDRLLVARELRKGFSNLLLVQVTDAEGFQKVLDDPAYDLVITDYQLHWSDGLTILRAIRAHAPECPVIMFTGTGSEEIAVQAMKAGLDDYILKSPGHFSRLPAAARLLIERSRQRQSTRAVETRAQKLMEGVPVGLYRVQPDGTILDINDAMVRLLGAGSREQLVNTNARQFFADPQIMERIITELVAKGRLERAEYILRRADGRLIWVEDNARAVLTSNGQLLYHEGSLEDITERKQAEEALRRSEDRFRSLVETIDDIIWEINEFRVFTYISPKIFPVLGYRPDEIIGRPYEELGLREEIEDLFSGYLANPAEARGFRIYENRFIHKEDEHRVIFETTVVPVEDERGEFRGFRGVCRDVTEKRKADQELRRTASELKAVIQALPDLYFRLTKDGVIIDYKAAQQEELYASPETFLGQTIDQVLPAPTSEQLSRAVRQVCQTGEQTVVDYTLPIAGEMRHFEARFLPLLEDQVVVLARDITGRKSRERQMESLILISTALRGAGTRMEISTLLLDQVLEHLRVVGAFLVLRDPLHEHELIELGRGTWQNLTSRALEEGAGIQTSSDAGSQPFTCPEIIDPDSLPHPELLAGLTSLACVPISTQSEIIGTLFVGDRRPFQETDISLLTAIGELAASSIQRASLHEQTELRLNRLTALRAIDLAISASLDLRITLGIMLGQVTVQLGIHAAGIMLLNASTQMLEYAAIRGFRSTAIQTMRQRLGEGYAGKAAVTRKPVIVQPLAEVGHCAGKDLLTSEGFTSYIAVPLVSKGQIKGVMELFHRDPIHPDPEWMDFLQAIASQAAIAIDNAEMFDRLQRSNVELTLAYDATIEGWARAQVMREKETPDQAQTRVELTLDLARRMGIAEADLIHMRRGVLLHDVGHLAIPDQILFKPAPLTEEEWQIMRQHPQLAWDMLSPINYLSQALEIPYAHHEHWDGSGYPRGLRGTEIPLAARVYQVVDAWDALRSDRPYRSAYDREDAVRLLREMAGTRFDPEVVAAFLISLGGSSE